jgi:hypothetical protein
LKVIDQEQHSHTSRRGENPNAAMRPDPHPGAGWSAETCVGLHLIRYGSMSLDVYRLGLDDLVAWQGSGLVSGGRSGGPNPVECGISLLKQHRAVATRAVRYEATPGVARSTSGCAAWNGPYERGLSGDLAVVLHSQHDAVSRLGRCAVSG